MKRLLILPILALIGAAAFCTGMFSAETEESHVIYLPTDSTPAVTAGVSDEYLSGTTSTPADTNTPASTEQATTTPGVTEFTHNGFLSGTVATPDTDVPETEASKPVTLPTLTLKPFTTAKPTTTAKPVVTKPVTSKPTLTVKPPVQNTPDSDELDRIVEIATGEIGVKEKKYNNVKYNTWFFGREVRDRSASSTNYAWCALFLGWCADQAGIDLDTIPLTRGTAAMQRFFKDQGRYTAYSKNYTPKVGDIIFIDWAGKRGSVDHVGIVIAVNNGVITTIEGNYSDQVSCNTYAMNSKYIAGYASPNYK